MAGMAPGPLVLALQRDLRALGYLRNGLDGHFRVPHPNDPDDFIVVGLNRGDAVRPDHITSRGYGIGQYTLFHHPPRADEVRTVLIDPLLNVRRAARELREKFDRFLVGAGLAVRPDERVAELGGGPLRA